MKRKRIVLSLTAAIFLLLLGAGYWAWDVSHLPRVPQNLGNWPRILRSLETHPPDRPVSFAVVGDTHNSQVFEDILNRLRDVELDFIVNLGDFVRHPTVWEHRLFLKEMEEHLPPTGPPMFLLAGNHDVDRKSFPLESFEALYGPSTFAFESGGNLFVGVCNALQGLKKGWGWQTELERILRERRGTAQRVFVFMHKPVIDPSDVSKEARTNRSLAFLEESGVDYAIAGDLHRYGRTQIGRTTVLVSSGGGGDLRGRFGKFHHTVLIRILDDQVTEEIMPVGISLNLEDRLASLFLGHILPHFGAAPDLAQLRRKVQGDRTKNPNGQDRAGAVRKGGQ